MRLHQNGRHAVRRAAWAAIAVFAAGLAGSAGQELAPAAYPNGKLLIEPLELKKAIDTSSVLVIDVRPAADYKAGHVPDAVWLDVEQWTQLSRRPAALTDAKLWAEQLGRLGIDQRMPVIVVDATVTPNAARVWWLLRYVGHPDVRLLNGGVAAWRAGGGTLGNDDVPIVKTKFEPKFQPQMLADAELVKKLIGQRDACLVDSRSAGEFTGEQVQGSRGGRVPGAKHVEWKEFLDPAGRFKPADDIAKLLAARQIAAEQTAVTYCQSGGRASLDAFALELMGFKNVKNYYRSWAEWSADAKWPIEKGK